ncbi:MAG: putative serine threonine-protein kinase nek2 [Streblomastix strix]|uniref:non-specific serine/threonine protein kinase n=1 Tax=Streblomastix strix TaxID=222440 RepID=A0A5J4X652_9EUKA|nr:MAG: putative serine threonine-protein kinase nek2 [Streblomastix strix]
MMDYTVLDSAGCRVLKNLGRGAFGTVYLVVSKDFGIATAKVMDLQHFNQREWDVAGKVSNGANVCQYVVNYKVAQIIQNSAVILMEYANLPPMQKILDYKFTPLPREDFVKPIIWQLLQGVVVIHEAGVIHQDLKPDNIMFHNIFGTDNVIVKITDYGLVREVDTFTGGGAQCGTPLGIPPEILIGSNQSAGQQQFQPGYNNKVDIWSLGVLFFQLLTKRYPFEAINIGQLINIIQRPIQNMPTNRSYQCIDLLKKMLQYNPNQRFSAKEALNHDWFKQDENGQQYQINPNTTINNHPLSTLGLREVIAYSYGYDWINQPQEQFEQQVNNKIAELKHHQQELIAQDPILSKGVQNINISIVHQPINVKQIHGQGQGQQAPAIRTPQYQQQQYSAPNGNVAYNPSPQIGAIPGQQYTGQQQQQQQYAGQQQQQYAGQQQQQPTIPGQQQQQYAQSPIIKQQYISPLINQSHRYHPNQKKIPFSQYQEHLDHHVAERVNAENMNRNHGVGRGGGHNNQAGHRQPQPPSPQPKQQHNAHIECLQCHQKIPFSQYQEHLDYHLSEVPFHNQKHEIFIEQKEQERIELEKEKERQRIRDQQERQRIEQENERQRIEQEKENQRIRDQQERQRIEQENERQRIEQEQLEKQRLERGFATFFGIKAQIQVQQSQSSSSSQQQISCFNTTWKLSDFIKIKKIGRGRFGTVYSMQEISTQRIVAIKECDYDTEELKSMMNREIEVMKDIIRIIRQSAHQSQFIHVVELFGFFVNEDEEKAYLVMELCSGGDLRGYIKNLQKMGSEISAKKCWEFVSSIVSAVYQLHEYDIIHGDLKPENVLLTEDIKVKLADFGLSRKLQQGKEYQTYHGGTKFYLAPEIQKDEIDQILAAGKQNQKLPMKRITQTKAVDIWAIGIMLYELLAQHHPFIHNDDDSSDLSDIQIAHRIVTEEPSELPAHYPDSLKKLIKAMLSKDPSRRISADEILSIPEVAANLKGQ